MSQNLNINDIQTVLGYTFKTPSLLSEAFTYSSADGTDGSAPLAFLGERLLDFVIADYVSLHYTDLNESGLCRTLNETKKALEYQSFISEHSLSKYIRLNASDEHLREERELHGRIFLAFLAAIYRDGGLPSLKSFILPLLRATGDENHYAPRNARRQPSESGAERESAFESKFVAVSKRGAGMRGLKSEVHTAVTEGTENTRAPLGDAETRVKNADGGDGVGYKREKKSGGILRALKLASKNRKGEEVQKIPNTETRAEVSEEAPKRSFIRDALAPVRLPENMRNPKPKRQYKSDSEKGSTVNAGNYKSILQEYVQKHIRTASVLIDYSTEQTDGGYVTELTLGGRPLSRAEGDTVKLAEQNAAKIAYTELNDSESAAFSLLSELRTLQQADVNALPDNCVSRLNEYFQKQTRSSSTPIRYEPRPTNEKGVYSLVITLDGKELAFGRGQSLKEARQDAAKKVCENLKI